MEQRKPARKRRRQAIIDGSGKIPHRTECRHRRRLNVEGKRDVWSGSDGSDDERKKIHEKYIDQAVDKEASNEETVLQSSLTGGPCHDQSQGTSVSHEVEENSHYSIPVAQNFSSSFDGSQASEDNIVNSSKETMEDDETSYDCLDVDPNWDEALFNVSKPSERDKLREILTDEEWNTPIQVPLAASKAEVLMGVLKLSLKHNWCLSETSEVLQLLNSLFVRSFLPETPYFLKELFGNAINVELHAVCPSCKLLVRKFDAGEHSVHCNNCDLEIIVSDPAFNNFFAVMGCRDQIKASIEANSEYYLSIMNKKSNNGTVFKDVTDGELWERVRNSLSPEDQKFFMSALFSCDAAPAFETSKYSITPYQFVINETPH
ncbi:hypothetical protein QAD02_019880 [Eretmocerus hayati]|uniref:Uncharacterized protein n=1 Tax=Eretmocerus hayati TaxID=131215 RepID=A0ACC2PM01_9HYME|nr:hypothetical protein QAD02_019880 [Eretmocerus hayati]